MPNGIAFLLGIALMFYLLSFLGTFGIILGVLILIFNAFIFWPR
jgi:hypothetical protein